jgi:hypothetical protein
MLSGWQAVVRSHNEQQRQLLLAGELDWAVEAACCATA